MISYKISYGTMFHNSAKVFDIGENEALLAQDMYTNSWKHAQVFAKVGKFNAMIGMSSSIECEY